MLVMIPIIAVFTFSNKHLGEADHSDKQSTRAVVILSVIIGLVLGGYQGFYGPGSGLFFMLAYAVCLKLDLVKAQEKALEKVQVNQVEVRNGKR